MILKGKKTPQNKLTHGKRMWRPLYGVMKSGLYCVAVTVSITLVVGLYGGVCVVV